jgi:predicted nucleic acid-binding protein
MIVLVDTSVWIDFFYGKPLPHVKVLELLIQNREDLATCGIILAETLQGIQNEKEYKKTKTLFQNLVYLPMSQSTYSQSAEIFRSLRKRGITIRKTVDCMIASVAIENSIPLLHHDRDFHPIQKYCGLKSMSISEP